jgi:Xaa-Pro aminopeptidase
MNAEHYARRRERLRPLLRENGLDALLVSLDANRFYLSGFELHDAQINESCGRLLITADGPDWLCTDPRFEEAARRLWDRDHIFIYSGNAAERLREFVKGRFSGAIGYESSCVSMAFYDSFAGGLSLKKADGLVEKLRVIKEPEEIARLERACALNHRLMEWLPQVLYPGRTEAQVAWDIEKFFRENGASELAFPSIVAAGANAAMCHAIPDDTVLHENCPLLVDVGCRVDDYCSDQTRTFWVGDRPADEFLRTRDMVQHAQRVAIDIMRPGMPLADAHNMALAVFERHGVAAAFTHSLGHGIGLQTHEAPAVNHRTDARLEPGMVITVEPGLYFPVWGGVRWEYMVHCTEDGVRVL